MVAWALFDPTLRSGADLRPGADARQTSENGNIPAESDVGHGVIMQPGDEDEPPYESVIEAMQDDWHVIQTPALLDDPKDFEQGHLRYEYILEKIV